jgi:hypothetical protein
MAWTLAGNAVNLEGRITTTDSTTMATTTTATSAGLSGTSRTTTRGEDSSGNTILRMFGMRGGEVQTAVAGWDSFEPITADYPGPFGNIDEASGTNADYLHYIESAPGETAAELIFTLEPGGGRAGDEPLRTTILPTCKSGLSLDVGGSSVSCGVAYQDPSILQLPAGMGWLMTLARYHADLADGNDFADNPNMGVDNSVGCIMAYWAPDNDPTFSSASVKGPYWLVGPMHELTDDSTGASVTAALWVSVPGVTIVEVDGRPTLFVYYVAEQGDYLDWKWGTSVADTDFQPGTWLRTIDLATLVSVIGDREMVATWDDLYRDGHRASRQQYPASGAGIAWSRGSPSVATTLADDVRLGELATGERAHPYRNARLRDAFGAVSDGGGPWTGGGAGNGAEADAVTAVGDASRRWRVESATLESDPADGDPGTVDTGLAASPWTDEELWEAKTGTYLLPGTQQGKVRFWVATGGDVTMGGSPPITVDAQGNAEFEDTFYMVYLVDPAPVAVDGNIVLYVTANPQTTDPRNEEDKGWRAYGTWRAAMLPAPVAGHFGTDFVVHGQLDVAPTSGSRDFVAADSLDSSNNVTIRRLDPDPVESPDGIWIVNVGATLEERYQGEATDGTATADAAWR